MIRHKVRKIFILWNRWGRVGEDGQHQSTPFSTEKEAVTEYCKIFKSKTGNVFGEKFEQKARKYRLIETVKTKSIDDILNKYPNLFYEFVDALMMHTFSLESSVKSELPEVLQESLKQFMNKSAMSQALKHVNISKIKMKSHILCSLVLTKT